MSLPAKLAPLLLLLGLPLTLTTQTPMIQANIEEPAEPWGIVPAPATSKPLPNPSPTVLPPAAPAFPPGETPYRQYRSVIDLTRNMVSDATAQSMARALNLNILNVTWEDTGRYQGSSVGPNISDMSIQVQQFNPNTRQYELNLMPVIRHPNFADITADVPLDRFYLRVGNQRGRNLERVNLRQFLGNLRRYLHTPNSWKGNNNSLLADRDTHVLVSAQACFLPIPPGGKAEFNPVLFNYQSYRENPAVLTILATREGTSVTIIDNQRDGFAAGRTWGQRLFFNKNGQRASLTGQRIADTLTTPPRSDMPNPRLTSEAAEAAGMNMVMLIQVPLKQKLRPPIVVAPMPAPMSAAPTVGTMMERQRSDVEAAVIGHGKVEGPFTEIDQLAIERDPRFPIRVTVQFYKATSNGIVSQADLAHIRRQIDRVYADADYVGSLVTGGDTGRPTVYDGPKQQPPGWWEDFWRRHEANTGQSRQEVLEMLRRLRGENWQPRNPQELQRELERLPK